MKSLSVLSILLLFVLKLNPLSANLQPSASEEPKYYVDLDHLEFAKEGIFFLADSGSSYEIQQIQFDGEGYFLAAGLFDSIFPKATVITSCKNCGKEYKNCCPVPCEGCDTDGGYDIIYVDDAFGT